MDSNKSVSIITDDKMDTWSGIEEDIGEAEGATDLISDRKWDVIFGEEEIYEEDPAINGTENITERIESGNKEESTKRPPIIFMPPQRTSREYFVSLKKWRGVVTELSDETFWAKLVDIQQDTPDEEAEIYRSELSEEDKKMLAIGAVFYWSIGYHTTEYGQRKRESIIRFRRLPVWSRRELERIRNRAQKFMDGLNLRDSDDEQFQETV